MFPAFTLRSARHSDNLQQKFAATDSVPSLVVNNLKEKKKFSLISRRTAAAGAAGGAECRGRWICIQINLRQLTHSDADGTHLIR